MRERESIKKKKEQSDRESERQRSALQRDAHGDQRHILPP